MWTLLIEIRMNMTYRQKVLKAVYPALMWLNKITGGRSKIMSNNKQATPPRSLYDLLGDSSTTEMN